VSDLARCVEPPTRDEIVTQQEKRMVGQVRYFHGLARPELMSRRNHRKNPGWEERATSKAPIAPYRDCELKLTAFELVQEACPRVFGQPQLDPGVMPTPPSRESSENTLDRHRGGADEKRARVPTLEGAGALVQRLDTGEEVPTSRQQVMAVTGESDPPADALEQPEAELGLEIADLAPQRGLSNSKPRGGLREAPRVGHRGEIAEVPELHRQSMPDGY
jgi:hypothetical protein